MKCLVFSAVALMMVLVNSCSRFPEDEKIKELILAHERPYFVKYHGSFVFPCLPYKAFEIPKEYKKISTLTRRDPHASDFEKDMATSNSILDKMTLNDLITMTKISDESGTNLLRERVNVKQYKIDLTSKGSENIVGSGSTADNFVVALFDLKDIEILQRNEIANDTLLVLYDFKPTPFYEVLVEFCDTTSLPITTSSARLVKQNGTWVVQ